MLARSVPVLAGLAILLVGCGRGAAASAVHHQRHAQRRNRAGAARTVLVPAVRGSLPSAYARLHRAGLRVSFSASIPAGGVSVWWPLIGQQRPRAGRRVRRGSIVQLRLQSPPCGAGSPAVGTPIPSATVPKFVGRTVADAKSWAERHRLYWRVKRLLPLRAGSAPSLLENYLVTHQRPAAGSTLAKGIGKGGGDRGSFRPTPLMLHARQQPIWAQGRCPFVPPRPLDAHALAHARHAARRWAAHDRGPTRGTRVRAMLARKDHDRGGEVRAQCGRGVQRRTVVVRLTSPGARQSPSLGRSVVLVSRFPGSYRVWEQLH